MTRPPHKAEPYTFGGPNPNRQVIDAEAHDIEEPPAPPDFIRPPELQDALTYLLVLAILILAFLCLWFPVVRECWILGGC